MTGCWIINMILLAADKRRSVSAGHCNGMSAADVRAACASGAGMRTAGASTPGGSLPPTDSCDDTAMSSPGVTGVILPKDALAEPITGGELCHTVQNKTRSEV